jgi:hypothetical protein
LLRTCLTFYFQNNGTENRLLFPDQFLLLPSFTNVRGMDPDGDLEAFYFFFDDLVLCVAGRKVWTLREKAIKLISEAKKVVSVLDEAFTILALMNYWERWTGNGTARWTDSKSGNYQYMGWADAAYLQFDELCKRIHEQRQTRLNKKLEQIYLTSSRSLLAGRGPHSQCLGGLVETNVEVYNELDSEEED